MRPISVLGAGRRRVENASALSGKYRCRARSEFIGGALQRQQWPGVPNTPFIKRRPVITLAIAVMVITLPARPEGVSTFSTASMTFSESSMSGSSGLP